MNRPNHRRGTDESVRFRPDSRNDDRPPPTNCCLLALTLFEHGILLPSFSLSTFFVKRSVASTAATGLRIRVCDFCRHQKGPKLRISLMPPSHFAPHEQSSRRKTLVLDPVNEKCSAKLTPCRGLELNERKVHLDSAAAGPDRVPVRKRASLRCPLPPLTSI